MSAKYMLKWESDCKTKIKLWSDKTTQKAALKEQRLCI